MFFTVSLQNAAASYDFSSNDRYPYPRYTDDWFNSHGTRCAGEIAAARDNNICGVGVAYDSKIAGTTSAGTIALLFCFSRYSYARSTLYDRYSLGNERWSMSKCFRWLDLIEANSMSHEPDLIDIYSASWGNEHRPILWTVNESNVFRTSGWWKDRGWSSPCNNESYCQRYQWGKTRFPFVHPHSSSSLLSQLGTPWSR